MKTIRLDLAPETKQRPRVSFKNGRAWAYTPKETKAYEESVRLLSFRHFPKKLEGPLELFVVFYTKKHADIDNLLKAFMDGLNGVAYHDDGQIVFLGAQRLSPKKGEAEHILFGIEEGE